MTLDNFEKIVHDFTRGEWHQTCNDAVVRSTNFLVGQSSAMSEGESFTSESKFVLLESKQHAVIFSRLVNCTQGVLNLLGVRNTLSFFLSF